MKKRNKLIIFIIVTGFMVFLVFFLLNMFRTDNTGQALDNQTNTIRVTEGTIVELISAEGSLEPIESVNVKSEVDGKIEIVLVKEGDTVKAGQPLLKLDTSDYEVNLKQAEADQLNAKTELDKLLDGATELETTQAETSLEQAKINYTNDREDFERNQKLFNSGAISQQSFKESQNQMDVNQQNVISAQKKLEDLKDGSDKNDIEVARAQLAKAEANLTDAKKKVDSGTITSPIDGTVILVSIEKEDVVTQAGTLIKVATLDTMKALVPFNEIDIPRINIGDKAEITLDAFPGEMIRGEIAFLSLEPETIDNIVTYEGEIIIPNSDGKLRRGMTIDADVIVNQSENTLLLPVDALIEKDHKTFVLVPELEGKSELVPIIIGIRTDTTFEVLEGLKKDQEVLTSSTTNPTDTTGSSPQRQGAMPFGMPAGPLRGH